MRGKANGWAMGTFYLLDSIRNNNRRMTHEKVLRIFDYLDGIRGQLFGAPLGI